MNPVKVINVVSFIFALLVVFSSLVFAYTLLAPIDVVRNWQLTVDGPVHHPRERVILHSSYEKLRDVNGTAYYYLECQNPNGSLTRYPISQSAGNRPKGKGNIDTPIQLPSETPQSPARCRIAISVSYDIYAFRRFVENNSSNYFEVIP